MPDNKWDRFKRAFGGDTSDALVQVRDQKVRDALKATDAQVAVITRAGLDAADLVQRRGAVEAARGAAMALKDNNAKGAALEKAKTDARTLRADATKAAEQRVAVLATDLAAARQTIATKVQAAAAVTFPAAQTAVQALAATVTLARDAAERLPTDGARLGALEAVDLAPLTAALGTAATIGKDDGVIKNIFRDFDRKLPTMKAGATKTGFEGEIATLRDRSRVLTAEVDVAAVKVGIATLKTDAIAVSQRFNTALGMAREFEKGIVTVDSRLDLVVDAAKALKHPATLVLVQTALAPVEQARAAANLLAGDKEKFDALATLEAGDLVKTLRQVVADAEGLDGGVGRMIAGVGKIIAKLPEGTEKTACQKGLGDVTQGAAAMVNVADLKAAKDGYAALRETVCALMDRAARAGGEEGFEIALKARYGVDVSVVQEDGKGVIDKLYRGVGGGATKFLDRTYAMFGEVPASHVGHEKLTKLIYNNVWEMGGAYSKKNNAIVMDNFVSFGDETYVLDGKEIPANKFNVTMLHEIGHAVDEKNGIMAGDHAGDDAYGGWKKEDKQSVAAKLAEAACTAMGAAASITPVVATQLMTAALEGKEPAKPGNATSPEWKAIQKYVKIAGAIREKANPWFKAKPSEVEVGGRVYVESYANDWHSYSVGAYAKTKVNAYQWRSPAEWFAEIYAVAWLAKKAPKQVAAPLAKWFPPAEA